MQNLRKISGKNLMLVCEPKVFTWQTSEYFSKQLICSHPAIDLIYLWAGIVRKWILAILIIMHLLQ